MLKSWRFWAGALLGLAFLALFLYGTDFGEMWASLRRAQYLYLLPALAAYFLAVAFRTWRWHYLLAPLKQVPSRRLFPIVVIGYMANNLLPLRLGEVVRAYIVGEKEGMSKAAALATAVVERLFDGLALIVFLLAVLPLMPLGWLGGQDGGLSLGVVVALFLVSGAIGVFLALFFWMALSPGAARALGNLALKLIPSHLKGRARELGGHFYGGLAALKKPRAVLLVTLLSFLVWLAEFFMYYLVAFSFSLGRPYLQIAFGGAAANLAISVPSLPGGVGPFEVVFQGVLTQMGMARDMASAYIIVLHAALLIPVTILGLALLWTENLSLARIARAGAYSGKAYASEGKK